MKSSTPWCNLYSSESKYSIAIRPSKFSQQLGYYITGLFFILSAVIVQTLSFTLGLSSTLLIAFIITLPLLLIIKYFNTECLSHFAEHNMLLSESGMLSIAANGHYQVSNDSLIFPFGCALSLQEIDRDNLLHKQLNLAGHCFVKNKPKKRVWVYKDNVGDDSYRRICRVINHQRGLANAGEMQ